MSLLELVGIGQFCDCAPEIWAGQFLCEPELLLYLPWGFGLVLI